MTNKLSVNCMYSNVDTLSNKMEELRNYVAMSNYDVVALTEVHAKKSNLERCEYVLQGYSCMTVMEDRGVCLFVKDGFDIVRLTEIEKIFQPSIFCKITPKGGKDSIIFGVVYRSPSYDNNAIICEQLHKLYKDIRDQQVIVVGDYNYPEINWKDDKCNTKDTHPAWKFLDVIHENFIFQNVTEPTHHRGQQQPNILDLILSDKEDRVQNLEYLAPLGKSHHSVLTFNLDGGYGVEDRERTLKPLIDKGDYQGMKNFLRQVNWSEKLDNLSVDESWTSIHDVIKTAMDKFIPKMRNNPNKKRRIPVPQSVLDKIRLKRRLYKMWKKYPTKENERNYAKARNQVKWITRKEEKRTEIKIAKNIKTNPKGLHNYLSTKSKPRESVANLIKDDGSLTENDSEKAHVLNNFFCSVFSVESDDDIPTFDSGTDAKLSDVKITQEMMLKALKALKPSKSPGPDEIHPRVLRETAEELSLPLKILFDKTMDTGKIPQDWKSAEVRPIFKKGNKNSAGNYRPVSLTAIVCKLFEGFIRDALATHFKDNELLSVNQFGFTSGRSCVTQLLSTVNDWLSELDDNKPVDAIYLDLKKAFDTVPHKRLINKIKGYGVCGRILEWVSDFLSERTQYVNVNGKVSDRVSVTSGVPQGSVLGPILFIYYINDLPDCVDCHTRIFADDTKAYSSILTTDDRDRLQTNIHHLVNWTDTWLLRFNSDKCKVLHLGKNNPNYPYVIREGNEERILDITTAEKDLGVTVDPLLDFDQHITNVVKKANSVSCMIARGINHKTKEIMLPLYKSIVRSIIEYANTVWCPHLRKHIDLIEGVQRRFTKLIIGCRGLSYNERLKFLGLPSLEYRRMRGDLIEVFKILHGCYDYTTTSSLFELSDGSSTRGHNFKLKKKRVCTNLYNKFFTNRVINTWNNLLNETVNAPSVNAFKGRVDRELSRFMYETNLS